MVSELFYANVVDNNSGHDEPSFMGVSTVGSMEWYVTHARLRDRSGIVVTVGRGLSINEQLGSVEWVFPTEIASRTEHVARSRAVSKENDDQLVGRVVPVTGWFAGGTLNQSYKEHKYIKNTEVVYIVQ